MQRRRGTAALECSGRRKAGLRRVRRPAGNSYASGKRETGAAHRHPAADMPRSRRESDQAASRNVRTTTDRNWRGARRSRTTDDTGGRPEKWPSGGRGWRAECRPGPSRSARSCCREAQRSAAARPASAARPITAAASPVAGLAVVAALDAAAAFCLLQPPPTPWPARRRRQPTTASGVALSCRPAAAAVVVPPTCSQCPRLHRLPYDFTRQTTNNTSRRYIRTFE